MKACWMPDTFGPMPTFSPSWVQGALTWLGRLLLWEMVPAAAIWADQLRAIEVRVPSTASVCRPLEARSWLVRARNWASSEPASALAGAAIATRPPKATSATSSEAATRLTQLGMFGVSVGYGAPLTDSVRRRAVDPGSGTTGGGGG